jgi:hypothetical protein
MHTIDHPATTQYYIAINSGEVSGYGYVEPTQRLDSGAEAFETFTTEAAMQARLIELGVTLQNVELDPDASPELQRLVLKAQINALREVKLTTPLSRSGVPYDNDERALSNVTGMIAAVGAGLVLPANFAWRDANNVCHAMDAAGLKSLAHCLMCYRNAVYAKSWALKAAVDAAEVPTSVDITSGWPACEVD